MKFTKNESGVSPVIGVILMVAITVTLAAIIAAFVMGNAGGVEKPKTVETRISQLSETVGDFTFVGGPDGNTVAYFNISGKNSDGTPINASMPDATVGKSIQITGLTSGQDHVIVVATFKDSTKQVVLDTYI